MNRLAVLSRPLAGLLCAQLLLGAAPARADELIRVVELARDVLRVVDRPSGELSDCPQADGFTFASQAALTEYRQHSRSLRSTISSTEAARMWELLASSEHIPFRYPDDGCYARAHEMSRILELNGIYSRKVFILGDLRADTPYAPGGSVDWRFHVAPVVNVLKPDGGSVEMVFDPSIMTGPVPFEEWRARMTSAPCPQSTVEEAMSTRSCNHYFTERFAYMDGLPDANATAWQPSDLSSSDATLREYLEAQRLRGY
ncbi:MAG: hypothetical protein IT285_13165 [Bdellovibrionales bacterium]|nr:hypothetical protein [Bdellovibrionales bacterium]